jgi:hypothetical protein
MRNLGMWVLLVVGLSTAACDRKKSDAGTSSSSSSTSSAEQIIDISRAAAEIEKQIGALWERPTVGKATDAFFEAVAGSSAVREQGMTLMTALESDPKVSAPIASLMQQLTEDPAIQKAALELMQKHPGASADQIGDMFGQHVEEVWSRPPVSEAWGESFQALIRRIEHDPDLSRIGATLFARIQPSYNDNVLADRWNKRVTELAGGSAPSRDKATDLFMKNFFGGERLDKLVADMLANPTLRTESATALAKLLAVPSVSRDLRTGAAEVLADPAVHQAALELFRQLATDHPEHDAVVHAFDAILTAPAMVKTLRNLLHDATTDPAVGAIGTAWIEHVTSDAGLKAAFDKFWFGW